MDWDALEARPYNTSCDTSRQDLRGVLFFRVPPPPPAFLDLFILLGLRLRDLDLRILSKGVSGGLGLLLAETTEKRDVVAKHGVVGAGVLHGCVELTFHAWDRLEKELAEVGEGGGGLVGDSFFG